MNIKQKITLVAVDAAILGELVWAMYAASFDQENFTAAFCKSFFSLFLPTLMAGVIAIRTLRDRKERQTEAA